MLSSEVLNDEADLARRNSLSQIAVRKRQNLRKNPSVKVKNKISIYNNYVRLIRTGNCSAWIYNKSFDQKTDIIDRKHMRQVVNIHYPKIISKIDLYLKELPKENIWNLWLIREKRSSCSKTSEETDHLSKTRQYKTEAHNSPQNQSSGSLNRNLHLFEERAFSKML